MSWPTKHGAAKRSVQLYRVWQAMIRRCHDTGSEMYHCYGARGISVCPEWRFDPLKFVDWALANGHAPGLSIDRINNDGNYEPSNCRFATPSQQSRNQSRTRLITWRGRTQCLTDWANETGIHKACIQVRLDRCGWTVERALTELPTPRVRKKKAYRDLEVSK